MSDELKAARAWLAAQNEDCGPSDLDELSRILFPRTPTSD